jgi:hypothetical protein
MLPIAKYHIVAARSVVSPNSASMHPVFSKNDTGGSLIIIIIIIRGFKSVKVEQTMENTVGS